MRLQKVIFCLMALCCLFARAEAQERVGSVNGIVRTEAGGPLSGVSVVATNQETGLSAGTVTDSAGIFRFQKLPAQGRYSFAFSSVGYQAQTLSGYTIKADGSVSILVRMKDAANYLSDVVVVGYGTQKRADITGAVTQVSGDVLSNRSIPNVTQGLEGVIPDRRAHV